MLTDPSEPLALISAVGGLAVLTVKSAPALLVPTPVPEPEIVRVLVPVEVVNPVLIAKAVDPPQEIEVGLKEELALACRLETDSPVMGPPKPPEQEAETL